MSFTGNEGDYVLLTDASSWTETYRNNNPGATKAHFFGKNKLVEILNQTNCAGIRMYYADNALGEKQLVLVGADYNEKDILTNGKIMDKSSPCPNYCDSTSPLFNNH